MTYGAHMHKSKNNKHKQILKCFLEPNLSPIEKEKNYDTWFDIFFSSLMFLLDKN